MVYEAQAFQLCVSGKRFFVELRKRFAGINLILILMIMFGNLFNIVLDLLSVTQLAYGNMLYCHGKISCQMDVYNATEISKSLVTYSSVKTR